MSEATLSEVKNVTEALSRIKEVAGQTTADVRIVPQMQIGQIVRQGDLYITRVADQLPSGLVAASSLQLVEGDTMGSRHCVRPRADLRVLTDPKDQDPLHGPFLSAPTGFYVEHPEHGHMDVRQAGCFRVEYQRDAAAEERARVCD